MDVSVKPSPDLPVYCRRYARGGDRGITVPVEAAFMRVAVRIPVAQTIRADNFIDFERIRIGTIGIDIVRSQRHAVVKIKAASGSRSKSGSLVLPAAYLAPIVGVMRLNQDFDIFGGGQ